MHPTALSYGKSFFDTYVPSAKGLKIVDIGSLDVNGALRSVTPAGNEFVGVDFAEGNGVDVVITDPYRLPFEDGSVDVCVSSSCFEHSEFFWLVFNDVMRILKPSGLFYLNVPSNGLFHRYPVDCWRFYPDSGHALQNWGRRSGYPVTMLESFTGRQSGGRWNDFVAVFVRDEAHLDLYPKRIQQARNDYRNGFVHGRTEPAQFSELPEDLEIEWAHRLRRLKNKIFGG